MRRGGLLAARAALAPGNDVVNLDAPVGIAQGTAVVVPGIDGLSGVVADVGAYHRVVLLFKDTSCALWRSRTRSADRSRQALAAVPVAAWAQSLTAMVSCTDNEKEGDTSFR